MTGPLLLAIDQGTSSTKCLVIDKSGSVVARGQTAVGLSTPQPGWVEQDGLAIWASVQQAVAVAVTADLAPHVIGIGLSTQRESCVIWDRQSGAPLTPVLSWQDQRTDALCAGLHTGGHGAMVRVRSGLPLDPMFSAAKISWLLNQIDPDRSRAAKGDICVGTIDSFLLSRFGGPHVVEAGNASRMQLMNVARGAYDQDLLDLFRIPAACLPQIVPSIGPFQAARDLAPLPDGVPILAVLADSHAALFAHGAFAPGPVKATHGTGSSVMGLLDRAATQDGSSLHPGLCVTLAWWTDQPYLAFEGNIRSAGSTLVWAADLLGVSLDQLAGLAATVDTASKIHLVPGFNGLGAPWWDAEAVATLSGFTIGSGRAPVARAALDSIAHQIADLVEAVSASGVTVDRLHVDGGPTRNNQLMQFEADMIGLPVHRAETAELSALGAAHLAGHAAGLFSLEQLKTLARNGTTFLPALPMAEREQCRRAWKTAVGRSLAPHNR
nr:FGGY family carbohydrate kinase [uncultured Dongia sp.]